MKTTVVIPNYNGMAYLENCLKSLEPEQETFRTLIIDNGSKDGSAEFARDNFPWAEVVFLPENTGFCGAVNEGIRRTSTEYVFLLNNDTVVRPGCVSALEERMDAEPRLFSLSARMVDLKNPEVMDGAGDLYNALGWAYALGKGKPAAQFNAPASVFSACGGAAIYRMDVLTKIGTFDENHFCYLEDVDLGYRGRIYGYRNGYEPKAIVLHAGSGATGSRYNTFKILHSARNNVYLLYKNMPLLQLILNLPLLLAGFLAKYLFFVRKGFGKDYLQGLADGVKLSFSPKGREHKVPFAWAHLGAYIRIQLELWINIFRRLG